MGVLNVTPDSFSDGGEYATHEAAIAHGRRLLAEGADIIDIGGESTRPGAAEISAAEQVRRILPVIRALAADGTVISVDTRAAAVMAAGVEAGARIINDISALEDDPAAMATVARTGAHLVLMHKQGSPATMQRNPRYTDVVGEVEDYLKRRLAACIGAGIAPERIALDPGIGFGKTLDDNVALIRAIRRFAALGQPLLVGLSRKSFIGRLGGTDDPRARLPGSLAAALVAVEQGAHILRVHDVGATRQALAVWQALRATA
jgi:dihydropteroate synthase